MRGCRCFLWNCAYGQLLRSLDYVLVVMTYDNRRAGHLSADALQERMSTALVRLGDAIAFLSRTAWPLVDLLIRIWIGKSTLILSVLISTDWTTVVRMAEGSYPIPDL